MKALAAGLIMLAGLASAQENSGLDELTTRDDLRGWEPVGRIDSADGGFCTGALIAADLVLTAAHCVLQTDGSPVPAADLIFRAGYSYGTALAEVPVRRTIALPEFRNIDPAPLEMLALDVALLELAQPIPSAVISPFTVALPGAGDAVSVVSYAEGREEALSWQRLCRVVGRRDALIAVDCDVTNGSSGAPVLDRSGYRAKIVSIISSGAEMDGKPVAVGMELPGIVERLKAALRRGDATSSADPAAGEDGAAVASGMPGKPVRRIVMQGEGSDAAGGEAGAGARFVSP